MEPRKDQRITVRLSESDRAKLGAEAKRRGCTEGAMLRILIREHLPQQTTR